jgi:hypothetical protein
MKYVIFFLLTAPALGATCKKLSDCVNHAAELSGKRILFDQKLIPASRELSAPVDVTRGNAALVLSEVLNVFGLARVPTKLGNTDRIIEARDIRFQSDLPTYQASRKVAPALPETLDPVVLNYSIVKGVDVAVAAKQIEPLLSRYGRVVPLRDGTIQVIDLATHVRKIVPVLQKQDFPLTAEERAALELEKKREHELEKKREHELELARLRGGDLHEIGPHKHPGDAEE